MRTAWGNFAEWPRFVKHRTIHESRITIYGFSRRGFMPSCKAMKAGFSSRTSLASSRAFSGRPGLAAKRNEGRDFPATECRVWPFGGDGSAELAAPALA